MKLASQGALLLEITAKGIEREADLTVSGENDYFHSFGMVEWIVYSSDSLYTVAPGKVVSYDMGCYEQTDVLEYTIQ